MKGRQGKVIVVRAFQRDRMSQVNLTESRKKVADMS
jgi:hypothetical protein